MPESELDTIREIFAIEREDQKDTEPRLGKHPVFQKAFEVQMALIGEKVEFNDLKSYWHKHIQLADDLTKEAQQAGLISKKVIIEGSELHVPEAKVNLALGTSSISSPTAGPGVGTFDSIITAGKREGPFRGFTLRFNRIGDKKSTLYAPAISYRIFKGRVVNPDSTSDLFINGDIATSSLEFQDDIRLETIREILRVLHEAAPRAKEPIEQLHNMLRVKNPGCQEMGLISNFACDIAFSVRDPDVCRVVEDYISEFIKQYIDTTPSYEISTDMYLLSQGNIKVGQYAMIYSKASSFAFEQPIQDFIFLNDHPKTPSHLLSEEGRSLHIVMSDPVNKENIYIPAALLNEFAKI